MGTRKPRWSTDLIPSQAMKQSFKTSHAPETVSPYTWSAKTALQKKCTYKGQVVESW